MGLHRDLSRVLIFLLLLSGACSKAYYRTMEALGKHKRELLVDRVDASREAQQEAKEQFRNALDEFSAVVGFDGGELEDLYDRLESTYERTEGRARRVRNENDDVERVAEALFEEWEEELDEYTDPELRRWSERQLAETRREYERLFRTMRRVEARMDPVLDTFRDQVLYLKHNLNARAVASLENRLSSLETDVARLIAEMEESIEEANRFIDAMQRTDAPSG